MKKAYFYFLVEPTIQKYVDNDSIRPIFEVPLITKTKTYKVALFSTKNTIYMLRIMIPDLEEEKIPEEDMKRVLTLKEHMLSVLRVTYNQDVSISPYNFWNFRYQNEPPDLNIGFNMFLNPDFQVNSENIRSVYINTFSVRNHIRLFSDAQDKRIPLQYRYLSLYKLIELEFKQKGQWREEFTKFLEKFEDDFTKLGLTKKKLNNYIHDIRDRCAHIKSAKEVIGVTELSREAAIEVSTFLPFLTNICATMLNEKYKDRGFSFIGGYGPPAPKSTGQQLKNEDLEGV